VKKTSFLLQNEITNFNIFEHLIYSFDGKAEFSLVQSLVSHDHSEIILIRLGQSRPNGLRVRPLTQRLWVGIDSQCVYLFTTYDS